MKTRFWTKKRTASLAMMAAMLLAALATMAFTPGAPAADDPPPPGPFNRLKERADERLENAFQRQQEWLEKQQAHLEKANQAAAKAQEWIDAAKVEGKDVAGPEAALLLFQTALVEAQASHDAAAGILAAHAGFDENGKVIDRTAAHRTVMDSRQSLMDSQRIVRRAAVELRRAVVDWRRANRPALTPQPGT